MDNDSDNLTYYVKNDFGLRPEPIRNISNMTVIDEETSVVVEDDINFKKSLTIRNSNKSDSSIERVDNTNNSDNVKSPKRTFNSNNGTEATPDKSDKKYDLKRRNTDFNPSKKSNKNLEKLNSPNVYRNIYRLKSILLGNVAVGKTSLLNRFLVNKFTNEYASSIGVEFKLKSMPIDDNTTVDLQIWDTCGQEKFRTLTRQYYREANAVILVFDLTSKSSFQDVETWIMDVKQHGPKECLLVLVGNKCDLKNQRVITFEEGIELAKKHNMDYIEVSAKYGYNIKFVFDILCRSLVKNIEDGICYGNFDKFDKRRSSSLVVIPGKENKSKCC